jgi:hypothetical protein
MDILLRKKYPFVSKSVISPNALAGSMAIQGIAMAFRIREYYPTVNLNETHPKVLFYALSGEKYYFSKLMKNWLFNQMEFFLDQMEVSNEDEFDALFSAWATWMGLQGNWKEDLMRDINNLILPISGVTYYWPENIGLEK